MLSKEQLDGNKIAWINWGVKCYNTNFGQVQVDEKTEELVECCIGLGRNQYNTEIGVTIYDGEFQIYRSRFNVIYSKLCSKNFPYPEKTNETLKIVDVLKILQLDDNDSIAAVLVKKELVRLMYSKLSFGKEELIALGELLKSWRKAIRKSDLKKEITRTPIIIRTPLLRRISS